MGLPTERDVRRASVGLPLSSPHLLLTAKAHGVVLYFVQQADLAHVLCGNAESTVSIGLDITNKHLEGQLEAVSPQPVGVRAQARVRAPEHVDSLVGGLWNTIGVRVRSCGHSQWTPHCAYVHYCIQHWSVER